MNHRSTGKHAVAELDREPKRLGRRSDDDADIASVVFLSQKRCLDLGVRLHGKTLDVEILGINLEGTLHRIGHEFSQRVSNDDGRGCWPLVAVDDEDAFRQRGSGNVRCENQQSRRQGNGCGHRHSRCDLAY